MRLLVLSDLHLEAENCWQMDRTFPEFDVAVLAGDIANPLWASVEKVGDWAALKGRPTILVPGNHEFYQTVAPEAVALAMKVKDHYPHLHLLTPGSVIIDDVQFVGATLWTNYQLYRTRKVSMEMAQALMRDHREIKTLDEKGKVVPFSVNRAVQYHRADREVIEQAFARRQTEKLVVVTHHGPSRRSIHPSFRGHALNPAYVSDLDDFIISGKPTLWIHGHVHSSWNYRIGRTRIIANPKGYGPKVPDGPVENGDFDPDLIVEI